MCPGDRTLAVPEGSSYGGLWDGGQGSDMANVGRDVGIFLNWVGQILYSGGYCEEKNLTFDKKYDINNTRRQRRKKANRILIHCKRELK